MSLRQDYRIKPLEQEEAPSSLAYDMARRAGWRGPEQDGLSDDRRAAPPWRAHLDERAALTRCNGGVAAAASVSWLRLMLGLS